MESMSVPVWLRLLLLYGHLLLCAYALHAVLKTDWRVLRHRIGPRSLMHVHRRIALVLAGLWLSGLAIVAIDLGGDWAQIAERPKLLAKLLCVLALTANAFVLRFYALPRIAALQPMPPAELRLLAVSGAISTTGWLLAAFIGLARPMAEWSAAHTLGLVAASLGTAALMAIRIGPLLLSRYSALQASPPSGQRPEVSPPTPLVRH